MITSKHKAFTLLEVLLAMALSSFILIACSTTLITMVNIWTGEDEQDKLVDHGEGVGVFLRKHFAKIDPKQGPLELTFLPGEQKNAKHVAAHFFVKKPNDFIFIKEYYGPIECYLYPHPDHGLVLIYTPVDKLKNQPIGPNPQYVRRISPWLKEIKYYYPNERDETKLWEITPTPLIKGDKLTPPKFMEYFFERENLTHSYKVALDTPFMPIETKSSRANKKPETQPDQPSNNQRSPRPSAPRR